MTATWVRDLYRIGPAAGYGAVTLRMLVAVGVPMLVGVLAGHPAAAVAGGATAMFVTLCDIGQSARVRLGTMFAGWLAILIGGTLGHLLDTTPYGREAVVLACALVAGWASGSHPGIAAVTRFFAVAAAAGTGMRFADPDVLLSVVAGGVMSFAAAYLAWKAFGIPPHENVMDWRAGVRRAFDGADAGLRFAVCYAAAAAVALFAASWLGVSESFWATLVVLMVMRREGTVSLELTVHYALGTILGVVLGAMVLHLGLAGSPLALAVLATAVASFARVGFSVNPCLGYVSFTTFLLFAMSMLKEEGAARLPHLFETRLYDVSVGCILALAGTLAATYPRRRAPGNSPAAQARP